MSMTHGQNGKEVPPRRPPSAASTHSSHSSSCSSKHVKCIGRYVLTGNTLGKGNFARVEAAVHTLTRAKVAIKIIETEQIKEEYVRKNLLREAQLMRRLRHPNIIRLYETMKTQQLYCLVMETADGGELLSHVRNDFKERRLPEATTRPFVRQLVSALQYLHSHGVVHRDLKMENILLDKKKRNVKIVDFGLSNHQKPGALLQTHCGSPEYAAPELFIPGRQYGPEVDVWSLGVNMYAMVIGKLPFRSPRQGTKKRQKLLEQITAGITEHHENEMSHLSQGAQDLICRLLQPDPSQRVTLEEVMLNPWITKDGTMPLAPFQQPPADPITEHQVIEMMNLVLGEPAGQIKEAVKRDRCDWLAAIYNLLMDQPEGRNILQRMMKEGPEGQLTSAAEYQSNTTEHLSLSQSQQSQDISDTNSTDAPGLMPAAPPLSHPHSQPHKHHQYTHYYRKPESDYEASTLPLTKGERRRHQTADARVLDQLRAHHTHSHHPAPIYSGRRNSIESPRHHIHQHAHTDYPYTRQPLRMPHEEPMYNYSSDNHHTQTRPSSRLSAPEPIPLPFHRSLIPNQQLYTGTSRVRNSSPPSQSKSPLGYVESVHSTRREGSPSSARGSRRKSGSSLKPVMKKSLSGSVDGQLDMTHNSAAMWRGRTQVAPFNRRVSIDVPPIGWSTQPQFGSNNRLATASKQTPADIASLMITTVSPTPGYRNEMTLSHGELQRIGSGGGASRVDGDGDLRSSHSIELKHELFRNSSHQIETVTEGIQIDMLPHDGGRMPSQKWRSSSAKSGPTRQSSVGFLGQRPSEFTASAKHLGERTMSASFDSSTAPLSLTHRRELPSLDQKPNGTMKGAVLDKRSPGGRRKSIGGLIGKAFKLRGGSEGRKERQIPAVAAGGGFIPDV